METKPGYKTTEFWLTIITAVAVLLAAVADVLPDKYAAIVASASTAAYAVARGLAKLGVKPDSPDVPPTT